MDCQLLMLSSFYLSNGILSHQERHFYLIVLPDQMMLTVLPDQVMLNSILEKPIWQAVSKATQDYK